MRCARSVNFFFRYVDYAPLFSASVLVDLRSAKKKNYASNGGKLVARIF